MGDSHDKMSSRSLKAYSLPKRDDSKASGQPFIYLKGCEVCLSTFPSFNSGFYSYTVCFLSILKILILCWILFYPKDLLRKKGFTDRDTVKTSLFCKPSKPWLPGYLKSLFKDDTVLIFVHLTFCISSNTWAN